MDGLYSSPNFLSPFLLDQIAQPVIYRMTAYDSGYGIIMSAVLEMCLQFQ